PIRFDILIRTVASSRTPDLSNIADFRADSESLERTRHWLAAREIVFHATPFGFACTCSKDQFKKAFGSIENPQPPTDMTELIEQVTLTVDPEFFDQGGMSLF
ncbi:MAG: hypothetical protein O7G85_15485, partial [Planctomycetota bacterium]|nr:hypothetical protein [Planctomycetota bacterium]